MTIHDDVPDEIVQVGDEDDERYNHLFHSIRSSTGLELGIRITWPECRPLQLSTVLPEAEISPIFGGTQWAGTVIWPAAVVLLQYLLQDDSIGESTSILELGCGLGVPGMILGEMRRCHVVVSDMDSLVEQLRANLQANDLQAPRIRAEALDWSRQGVQDLLTVVDRSDSGFDYAIHCDCVYEPLYGESWKQLLEAQEELLRVNPKTVLYASIERRRVDGADRYLEALRQSPWVARVEQIFPDFEYSKVVEVYRAYGKEG